MKSNLIFLWVLHESLPSCLNHRREVNHGTHNWHLRWDYSSRSVVFACIYCTHCIQQQTKRNRNHIQRFLHQEQEIAQTQIDWPIAKQWYHMRGGGHPSFSIPKFLCKNLIGSANDFFKRIVVIRRITLHIIRACHCRPQNLSARKGSV